MNAGLQCEKGKDGTISVLSATPVVLGTMHTQKQSSFVFFDFGPWL